MSNPNREYTTKASALRAMRGLEVTGEPVKLENGMWTFPKADGPITIPAPEQPLVPTPPTDSELALNAKTKPMKPIPSARKVAREQVVQKSMIDESHSEADEKEVVELGRRTQVLDGKHSKQKKIERIVDTVRTGKGLKKLGTGSLDPSKPLPKIMASATSTRNCRITWIGENRKKPGSKAHAFFAKYKVGMLSSELLRAEGKEYDRYIRFDILKGYIKVELL